MPEKTMTVRLAEDQADALEALAQVDGASISELVRCAIGDYIDRRRSDGGFRERVEASLDAHRDRLLRGLSLESPHGTRRRRGASD